MGSRIRSTPSTLLECWCEVVAGQGPDQPPWIIQKFPSTYDDHSTLNSVPQFVFPCKIETNVVQNFSFVLTALDSKFTFGFCRHSPNAQSAIVILSFLPWDSTFYKIMNLCSELQSSENPEDVWSFLKALYNTPVPEPGSDLAFSYPPANKMFVAKCPDHLSLPSLPDNRNLLEYINAVSTETMMVVFASLLFERRILISSRHLHRVSACVQAANALLYPMTWQHIYIPIMPELLLDYLLAPIPFLIGVPDVLMKKVSLDEVGDVVYLNADTNVIRTPFNDLAELPNEVCSQLRRRLSQPGQGMGDSVPRAFLRALVMLIGNYRDALQFNEEDRKVFFNADKFVASRPQHLQVFVTKMLELQIFSQFIEERLDLVNKGEAKSDEFEMEVSVHSDRPRKNYQHLVHAVKKEGGAIVKNFKSKTNPAVKSAVKSVSKSSKQVRERGAEKYKEIKGKMKLPAGRSPEHIVWSAPDLPEHSPPPSPPSRLPTNRPNMEVTSKVTYKRPLPNNRAPSDQDGVPSSRSSSSFRSPDSPGHTPAPHSIDLVGELEQELLCRLSEPSALSSRPSLSTPFSSSTSTTNTTSTTGGQPAILNGSRRRSVTRPTVLPPPIPTVIPPPVPAARAHTTLGSTRGHDKESPTSQGLVVTKDRDLILLGSPLEEEFDPLMSKSVAPPVPSTAPPPDLNLLPPPRPPPRPDAPHPVPSFLHSLPTASRLLEASSSSSSSSSVYQPYVPFSSSLHDIKSPTVELLSPTSTTSSSLPDFSCTSSASPSSVCTATATDTLSTCRGTSDQPLGIPPPTPLPLLPSPARRPSSGSLGGQQRSGHHIPSQTMASLPAALQNHLANQLNRTPQKNNSSSPLPPAAPVGSSSKNLSAFDDPRFVPFHTRFQSTSTAPPTAQANPLYNAHDLATSIQTSGARDASTVSELNSQSMSANSNVGKPNFAAAFASTMIKTGDQLAANNNNVIEPKMLGSFSESFAQMKLNKSLVAEPVTSSTSTQSTKQQKPPWTSFE
ncbi:DENN domain-containing protein 1B isoform X6 [Hyalella azteca]|uniref:DENN domain-containing protein 1B isoform X6 n=1 Tax=Hyalella azteca TaxID=294128 RepID=A0A8B7NB03_HYAAZ|nr:DENN domain-containing protein 1B isoform X6 [Hyalella azteca]